jgi:hypothetical protein
MSPSDDVRRVLWSGAIATFTGPERVSSVDPPAIPVTPPDENTPVANRTATTTTTATTPPSNAKVGTGDFFGLGGVMI